MYWDLSVAGPRSHSTSCAHPLFDRAGLPATHRRAVGQHAGIAYGRILTGHSTRIDVPLAHYLQAKPVGEIEADM